MPCEAPVRCSRCGNEVTGVKCLVCGLPQAKETETAAELASLKQALIDAYKGKGNSVLSWDDVRSDVLDGGLCQALDRLAKYESTGLSPEEISELAAEIFDQKRTCRVCGCTDDNACPGGCYWVEDDLCSRCADEAKVAATQSTDRLTEFCRSIDCVFRRLMDDEKYQPGGSQAEKVAILQGACLSCNAWQYEQYIKRGY